MRLSVRLHTTLFYAVLCLIILFFVSPVIWLVLTSVKNYIDAFSMPPVFFFKPTFDNYINVLSRSNFLLALWNSIFISFSASALSILLGASLAYGLAFLNVKSRVKIITFILSVSVAPPIMLLLPFYYLGSQLHLINTYGLLIGVYLLLNLPFSILMLLTFFEESRKRFVNPL
ncbi:carbohydrate ABC transporter permease [Gordoniibacillus kamchatkensis]|uniref:carbohydrate ABC transporter permease n=1 Tax=Gordoniibacillus kamchatkensis TaxID=1590651 RepID=UPI000AC81738|nr:carbohydrate ABC transporter permease [Paenibacillus sp. VKM B-2647]